LPRANSQLSSLFCRRVGDDETKRFIRLTPVKSGQALGSAVDVVVVVVVSGRRGGGGVSLDSLDGWRQAFAGSAVSHEERVLDDDAAFGAGQTCHEKKTQICNL